MSDLLTGTVRPEPRDILRLLQVLSPPAVRAAVDNRRVADWHPWLRPAAAREIARRWNADGASEPVTWNARVRDYSRRRHLRLTVHSMNLMAMDHDVVASHPLADPGFLSALGASKRWRGYTDRTATMRALFGDLLPPDVVARPTKALFSQVFTSDDRSRTFLGDWTGAGVDQSLVDVDALRAMWMGNRTPSLTVLMLQSAWLASQQARGAHGTGVDGR